MCTLLIDRPAYRFFTAPSPQLRPQSENSTQASQNADKTDESSVFFSLTLSDKWNSENVWLLSVAMVQNFKERCRDKVGMSEVKEQIYPRVVLVLSAFTVLLVRHKVTTVSLCPYLIPQKSLSLSFIVFKCKGIFLFFLKNNFVLNMFGFRIISCISVSKD